jgi:hypothetical protein
MHRLLLIVALLFACTPAQAEVLFPPGLRVGLEPAPGLKPGTGIPGFEDPANHVTVGIAELPAAAYPNVADAMFGKAPADASKITRELFLFHDGAAYLHSAHVVEDGIAAHRWLLMSLTTDETPNFVAVVNVKVPDAASKLYPDAVVRKMLASTTIRKPPIEEQLKLIPFKVDDLAGFRVMKVTPGSVLLIDGPDDDIGKHPYIIVSIGSAPLSQLEDRGRFSRDLLSSVPFRDLTLQSAEDMRIRGRPGFEIRGRGKDPHGQAVTMVQWVRFTGGGFIRIIAASPSEQWDEMFNRFRAVRDGVDLR